ncbi:FadR/GntR family transcriptional regulator [Alteribacillus persepolensis]|uniref:FadR/GntR family transcriptional regulator n=1 Tax=Alteribacillus persepolensis TaxID=568899 RepID=UPI000B84083E|nr:FadR/GntR family transcriptional regulator [Alteribacillus persepolensis]
MAIEKIVTKKVSVLVAEQIEEMIKNQTLKPGDKLPSIRELCEQLDVGRSAVRDALLTLNGKGAVHMKQGEGAFICEFDSKNLFNQTAISAEKRHMKELFQVRKILETGAAAAAAKDCTGEDIQALEILLTDSLREWGADYKFHLKIAKMTGNPILVQLMEFISATMTQAMKDFHVQISENGEELHRIMEQHVRIFEAIQAADPNQAKRAMMEHLHHVEKLLLEKTSQK